MMVAVAAVTVVATATSFLCSLAEAAFNGVSVARIEELRAQGTKAGERLAVLRQEPDEPMAAIVALRTVAVSGGALLVGALVGAAFPEQLLAASTIAFFAFVAVILYLGRVVPQLIGARNADRLAPAMVGTISLAVRVAHPLVLLGLALVRAAGYKPPKTARGPSERELIALAELGARAGTVPADEAQLAINAFRLNDIAARDLMTPRTVVYVLPADLPLSMITPHSDHWTHSRLPVVHNRNPDQVEGIVYRREVFDELAEYDDAELANRKLRDLMHPPVFVPETIRCNELLRKFLDSKQKLAIVTNEFGGLEGVISLEDVLEFLIGEEIVDIHDKHADMQQYAREVAQQKLRRKELALTPSPRAERKPPTA